MLSKNFISKKHFWSTALLLALERAVIVPLLLWKFISVLHTILYLYAYGHRGENYKDGMMSIAGKLFGGKG